MNELIEHTVRFARWRYENADDLRYLATLMSEQEFLTILALLENAFIEGGIAFSQNLLSNMEKRHAS